ncbi:hypothetical protein CE91St36_14740 [Christensenellaceae bacterium]|nr:hypothetical protein CE91St36_14740 [Christensenellaceae bacterium]BDF61325.1 hypothetical protein CE91St37_14750 [Christensenellaceae bacterium]
MRKTFVILFCSLIAFMVIYSSVAPRTGSSRPEIASALYPAYKAGDVVSSWGGSTCPVCGQPCYTTEETINGGLQRVVTWYCGTNGGDGTASCSNNRAQRIIGRVIEWNESR